MTAEDRHPYVGEGADGARRSAIIDRSEADGIDPFGDAERYADVMRSAERWDAQVRRLDQGHRAVMAGHLSAIEDALTAMLGYWIEHDLPADFLEPPEFPFARSLEDQQAEVSHAVDLLRNP